MPEEEKDEKTPWNIKLSGIIFQAVAGGGFSAFITLLNTSDLPKLALGSLIGSGILFSNIKTLTMAYAKRAKG